MSRVTIKVDAVVDGACGPEEAAKLRRWIRDDKPSPSEWAGAPSSLVSK